MSLFGLFGPPKVGKLKAEGDVEGLIKASGYKKDAAIRQAAAEALGQIGDAGVVDPLITALKDEEWSVRCAAARALGELGNSQAVELLITALEDKDWHVRQAAAEALGQIGDAEVVDPLITALYDSSKNVRRAAAEALEKTGAPAVASLVAALKDVNIRQIVTGVLVKIGASAVEVLVLALKDDDEDIRWSATSLLGRIGGSQVVEPLIRALEDEDDYVRRGATEALGQIGDARAVRALAPFLRDGEQDIRETAADALVRIDDKRAIQSLIAALKDEEWSVRQSAASALGKTGDKRAVEPLKAILRDEQEDVRRAVSSALKSITGQDYGPISKEDAAARHTIGSDRDVVESLKQENWSSLPSVLLYMSELSAELDDGIGAITLGGGMDAIFKAMQLNNRHLSLLSAHKPDIFVPLGETLFHDNPKVSAKAAYFLRRFALDGEQMPENVIANLGKATGLQDEHTSSEACTALEKLIEGGQDIIPAMDGLTTALASVENRDQLVKIIDLIGTLRDAAASARPLLLPLLDSPDIDVKNSAEKALTLVGGQEPEEALIGENVLDLEPWDTSPSPKDTNIGGNLAILSWNTPLSSSSREPMVVDRASNIIYCGKSPYRFDLQGNPRGKLQLGNGGLAVTEDGELLVSDGAWLYRVDSNGNVLSALKTGWFQSLDVLSNKTIAGVVGQSEETSLGFVEDNQVHRVDVSGTIYFGRDARGSSDGHLYVVGSRGPKSFWASTVFKLSSSGHVLDSKSMFTNIGAICPTQSGGVDVIEMDGNRLVRLSGDLKVVYDSKKDNSLEADTFVQPEYLDYVSGMDVDQNGNCYILARGQMKKFPLFWSELAGPKSHRH